MTKGASLVCTARVWCAPEGAPRRADPVLLLSSPLPLPFVPLTPGHPPRHIPSAAASKKSSSSPVKSDDGKTTWPEFRSRRTAELKEEEPNQVRHTHTLSLSRLLSCV